MAHHPSDAEERPWPRGPLSPGARAALSDPSRSVVPGRSGIPLKLGPPGLLKSPSMLHRRNQDHGRSFAQDLLQAAQEIGARMIRGEVLASCQADYVMVHGLPVHAHDRACVYVQKDPRLLQRPCPFGNAGEPCSKAPSQCVFPRLKPATRLPFQPRCGSCLPRFVGSRRRPPRLRLREAVQDQYGFRPRCPRPGPAPGRGCAPRSDKQSSPLWVFPRPRVDSCKIANAVS
jgi:hypothetical protein